jgi:hypothetical protein
MQVLPEHFPRLGITTCWRAMGATGSVAPAVRHAIAQLPGRMTCIRNVLSPPFGAIHLLNEFQKSIDMPTAFMCRHPMCMGQMSLARCGHLMGGPDWLLFRTLSSSRIGGAPWAVVETGGRACLAGDGDRFRPRGEGLVRLPAVRKKGR